jgi:hypothetical protein
MKKLLSWIVYIYAATTVVLAAYVFYLFKAEAFLLLSAEQAYNIQMQFYQLYSAYMSYRAGA